MSDLKIDPEDGLAVQDLSTLDVSRQKKRVGVRMGWVDRIPATFENL